MAQNSSIEWTDHTFNPWWGCSKVSPGCLHCYAETWAKRVGQKVWGVRSSRRLFGTAHWEEPVRWDAEAEASGIRRRVFCASMADVFESRSELTDEREKLWTLIEATPSLDWLLLTKRPQNIFRFAPWSNEWPNNVWVGTTVENQHWAKIRLPQLLAVPAERRFLSCEPLLGPLDLRPWTSDRAKNLYPIDWVIAGGESGPKARAMLPGWARDLRDQCRSAEIPFHFKQWGHWAPAQKGSEGATEFWDAVEGKLIKMVPLGKKPAGRFLDGKTWNQVPRAA
jgi:protein gp37